MPLARQQKDLNITSLQSYMIALDDAIDVKLETFEAHMEDKLRALFKEFRLSRSESPKRSQCEESSNRKQNQFEKGDQAQDSTYPRMRMNFPRWEDRGPIRWILRDARYFHFHKTLEASMVDIATMHLEGDAI
ncbi:hypothetical protein B296_00015281 [Ensete ventricosum]|uniref:Uncharacterized protein n=1 Tax=Ensete ventricosum TaxID=4639 RepID=A0A426ZHW1_ENSVE|nr:hypothetical protein B296_00015281 [Ensete ventricosum]